MARGPRSSGRQRGVKPANEASNQCVWFRFLVYQAKHNLIAASPGGYVHSSKLQSGIIAAIEDMADRTKKYREILGSLESPLKASVKNTMKQITCFDRNPTKAAPGYFFWNTKQLVNDPCTHTGSNCLACKGNGNYGAVYGNTNLTKDGAPKPKPKRTNRKSAKSMGRGNVLGRVCYGMGVIETVSEQDVTATALAKPRGSQTRPASRCGGTGRW